MTCPEIVDPNRTRMRVDLSRYYHLHPEGRLLISTWFQRACRERNCQIDEAFEPFIFAWFAFNGWAACVTDQDRDRDIIDALAADARINSDFARVIHDNEDIRQTVNYFFGLLPIFDVKSLQRRGILRNEIENRRERVNYYLLNGADKFEPKCWQHHHNAGEATPVDWGHFINAVYKVRCNLFHGLKAAHSEMDQVIVHSSYLALVKFLDEVGYINA
ncbi:MAG TPA: hypothetical protein PLT26_12475 [Anaerolineaceae bacterium]|jgi:hypothetical protein|nr:hypothetical protein [Anaerolineaceae bacterium]HQH87040.1 hypothetical protein [Anaerolineaceae bacterium]